MTQSGPARCASTAAAAASVVAVAVDPAGCRSRFEGTGMPRLEPDQRVPMSICCCCSNLLASRSGVRCHRWLRSDGANRVGSAAAKEYSVCSDPRPVQHLRSAPQQCGASPVIEIQKSIVLEDQQPNYITEDYYHPKSVCPNSKTYIRTESVKLIPQIIIDSAKVTSIVELCGVSASSVPRVC